MSASTKTAITPPEDERYGRLRLIPWWDEAKVRATKVLVVGAGALGNEILKNLALLGFQQLVVVDMDRIERSNLSRAVLFRDSQVGQFKAEAVADSLGALGTGAQVQPLVANISQECGLGLFAWSDIIIGGVDNREARLWMNRAAWKVNRPWVDGAIEGINGVARVFLPGSAPCYECTLGETDWALLEKRMSCNLLLREASPAGKIATTPTISSIIAGIQVQEAMKLAHGLPTLAGKGFIFEGLQHSSYVVEYTENPDCMSHYTFDEIISLPQQSSELTLKDLLARAREDLVADEVVIEFSRDVIERLECPSCYAVEEVFRPVGALSFEQGKCPADGHLRMVITRHSFSGNEPIGTKRLSELGLPLFDIFTARSAEKELAYLLAADGEQVLGSLAASTLNTECYGKGKA